MPRYLYKHFTLPEYSGFLNDVPVALTDKSNQIFPTKCEEYWIGALKPKRHWN